MGYVLLSLAIAWMAAHRIGFVSSEFKAAFLALGILVALDQKRLGAALGSFSLGGILVLSGFVILFQMTLLLNRFTVAEATFPLFLTIFYVLVASVRDWRSVFHCFGVGLASFAGFLAIARMFGGGKQVFSRLTYGDLNANELGSMLVLPLPFLMFDTRMKLSYRLGFSALAGVIALWTGSRTTMGILFFYLLVVAILYSVRAVSGEGKKGIVVIGLLWAVSTVVICSDSVQNSIYRNMDTTGRDRTANVLFSNRVGIWRVLLQRAADNPWVGYGSGATYVSEYQSRLATRRATARSHSAHNQLLEVLVAQGAIALGVLLLVVLGAYGILCTRILMEGVFSPRTLESPNLVAFLVLAGCSMHAMTEAKLISVGSIQGMAFWTSILVAFIKPQDQRPATRASYFYFGAANRTRHKVAYGGAD